MAHSTWGATASGAECTYTTPRLGTAYLPEMRCVFPYDLSTSGVTANSV